MKKNTIVKLNSKVFYIAYTLILCTSYMSRVVIINNYLKYFKLLGVILLLFNCFFQSYSKNSLIKVFLLTLIGFLTYYSSKSDIILIFLLTLFSIKNIELNKVIKFDMYIRIFIVITLFIFHCLNMTNEVPPLRDGIIRYSFGFSHPNLFGFVIASILMDFIYLNKDKNEIYIYYIYSIKYYFYRLLR